jgi:hypothetical protein
MVRHLKEYINRTIEQWRDMEDFEASLWVGELIIDCRFDIDAGE